MTLSRRDLLAVGGSTAVALLAGGCDMLGGTPTPPPTTRRRIAYGPEPAQHADLYLPVGTRRPGTVVIVHGGFWLAEFTSDLGAPLALDLARRGRAVWNLEYRAIGDGGGWPNTLADIAAGIDHLADLRSTGVALDLDHVVVVGHSAGGQLGVWAAARDHLPGDAPGGSPRVRVTSVVAQAGVLDLVRADREDVGEGAVDGFLGGHATQVPARYAAASPVALLPISAPVRCVHSRTDGSVPFTQSQSYVAAARAAGSTANLVVVPGTHLDQIDPTSAAWRTVLGLLPELLGG